jgi:ABC-type phosphate transport system substrate-binding protein
MAILALLGLVAGAIWWWGNRQKAIAARSEHMLCCIKDVSGIPPGKFTYTAERYGIWTYVLQQENLIEKNKTLKAELERRRPELDLTYLPQRTGEEAIAKVRQEQVDFAITSLVDDLTYDLEAQEFAYDGLVVFVAFSYERRDKTLPKFLNGQITFEQLRQLYTGKITNWKDLGGPDLPVRLYMPTETETVRIFEQRVLKSEESIAQFRQLWQSQAPSDNSIITQQADKIIQLSTLPTLRTVLRDFEDEKIGGIGFGPLSKVFGQCSVYPLAIVDADHSPVQPLNQDIGQPIDPSTDLCNKKGSYRPNIEVFSTRRYPLAYPLAVIYPRDNSRLPIGKKFAEILKTQESQQLLSKTGLVPLQPLK